MAVTSEKAAVAASQMVQSDLARVSLVVHVAKSMLEPSHQGTWLGYDIDLGKGSISVPKQKINSLRAQVCQAMECKKLQAKILASVIGKIISMAIAIGPVTRLVTRNLYTILNSRWVWCEDLELSVDAKPELHFGPKSYPNSMDRTFGQARQPSGWFIQMPAKVAMEDTQLSMAAT